MDSKLLRYYKKKIYGGRSIAARVMDFVLLRLFLLFIIFVFVLYLSLSTTVALLMSIFLTAAFSLALSAYNKKKAERFIIKDLQRIKRKCLLEKLTFMNADDYAEYINKMHGGRIKNIVHNGDGFFGDYDGKIVYAFHNHPSCECGVSDVLKVIRIMGDDKEVLILSLSEFSDDARKMCKSIGNVQLTDGEGVLETADKVGMLPDQDEAEKNAEKEMRDAVVTLRQIEKSAFKRSKIKGYIICGIVIMCWPLVTGFRIYYPIIAVICFIMALITYKRTKTDVKESSDIGIS